MTISPLSTIVATSTDSKPVASTSRPSLQHVPNSVVQRPYPEPDAHELASAMNKARRRLDHLTPPASAVPTPLTVARQTTVTDKYAFAFDIDGVLIRGGNAIPEAIQAMRVLNGENRWGIKVPYIFVTNGGGKTEQARCIQLSEQLQHEVSPGQFICGHTPMRELAEKYKTVLIVGGQGETCRYVAEGYGFKDVVTPRDIMKHNPHTTPFSELPPDVLATAKGRDLSDTCIEAILVMADSRDWAADQQIIIDLLLSKNGKLGTRSDSFQEGPPLFFAHNDVVWSAQHELTRLGMGALRLSIEAMYKAVTGKVVTTTAFGKPQVDTFSFASRLLKQWRGDTHGINEPVSTVYFVGDTPESDIRGTNTYDDHAKEEWYSILVKTGVYEDGTVPAFKPRATVNNVLEAVLHGIEREQEKELAVSAADSDSDA